jgi:histidyl-tRNA synthetase
MERLLLVIAAAAQADPDGPAARLTATPAPLVYIINRGEQAEPQALTLARQWRGAGLAVELDGSSATFGKQFKRADRSGAPWAVVLGDEEALAGQLRLKPLRGEGEEQQLTWEDALSYLTKQR